MPDQEGFPENIDSDEPDRYEPEDDVHYDQNDKHPACPDVCSPYSSLL
jgi:hypothetical protein